MSTINQSNNNRNTKNLIIIVVGVILLLLPLLINFLFQNYELIETRFKDSEWLSFWSNYIPGLATCAFAYWAIVEANKNSQMAIDQQNTAIIIQENKEILSKFTVVLKQINDCFRIFEVDSVRYSFDIQKLTASKNKILQLTSKLDCIFIEWSMLINFYNNYASCFQQYKYIWDKARVLYSNYTDELLIYIEKYNLDNYQKVYDIMSKIDFSNKALGEIANGFVEQFAKEFSYSDVDRNKLESDRNQLLKYQKQLLKYSEYSLKQLDGQLRQKVSLS